MTRIFNGSIGFPSICFVSSLIGNNVFNCNPFYLSQYVDKVVGSTLFTGFSHSVK